jgi:hypothetical protein
MNRAVYFRVPCVGTKHLSEGFIVTEDFKEHSSDRHLDQRIDIHCTPGGADSDMEPFPSKSKEL